jgi:hypothetical protein
VPQFTRKGRRKKMIAAKKVQRNAVAIQEHLNKRVKRRGDGIASSAVRIFSGWIRTVTEPGAVYFGI